MKYYFLLLRWYSKPMFLHGCIFTVKTSEKMFWLFRKKREKCYLKMWFFETIFMLIVWLVKKNTLFEKNLFFWQNVRLCIFLLFSSVAHTSAMSAEWIFLLTLFCTREGYLWYLFLLFYICLNTKKIKLFNKYLLLCLDVFSHI